VHIPDGFLDAKTAVVTGALSVAGVALALGFEHLGGAVLPAPLAAYALPGCKSPMVATAVAGVVGALVVFGLALVLSRVLVPRPAGGDQ